MQPAHSKNDLGSPRQKGSSPAPSRNAGLGVLQSMLRAQVGNTQTLIISKSREQMMQTVQPKLTELTLGDGKPIQLQPLHKCLRLTAINLFHGLLLLGANPAHGCGKQFSTDLLQSLLGGYKYAELEEIKQVAVSCAGNPELIDKSADAYLVRLFREETIRVDTGGSENAHDSTPHATEEYPDNLGHQSDNNSAGGPRWEIIRQFCQPTDGNKPPLDEVLKMLADIFRRVKLPSRLVVVHSLKKTHGKSTGLEAFNRKATGQPKAKTVFETEGFPKIAVSVVEKNKNEFNLRFGIIKLKDDHIGYGSTTKIHANNNSANSSNKKGEPNRSDILSKTNKNLIMIEDQPEAAFELKATQTQVGMIRQTSSNDYGGRIDNQAKKLINDFMQKLKPAEEVTATPVAPKEPQSATFTKHHFPRQLIDIDAAKLNSRDQLLPNQDTKTEITIVGDKPRNLALPLQIMKQQSGKKDSGAKTSGRATDSASLVTNFQLPIHSLYANNQRRQDLQQTGNPNSMARQRAVGKSLDEPKMQVNFSASQRISKLIPTLDVTQLRHSLEVINKTNYKANPVMKLGEPRTKLASNRLAEPEQRPSELVTVSNKNSARSPKNQPILNVYSSPLVPGTRKVPEAPNPSQREILAKNDQKTPENSHKLLEQLKNEGADPVSLQDATSLKLAGLSKYLKKDVNHQRKKSKPEPALGATFSNNQSILPKPSLTARDKPSTVPSIIAQSHIVNQTPALLSGLTESKPYRQDVPLVNKSVPSATSFMNLYYKQEKYDTIQEDTEPKSTLSVELLKNESFEAIKLEDLNPLGTPQMQAGSMNKPLDRAAAGIKGIKTKFKSLLIRPEHTHLDSVFPIPRKTNPTPLNTSEIDISTHIRSPRKDKSQMLESFEEEQTDRKTVERKASEQISIDQQNQSKVNSSGASWKFGLIPKQQNEHYIKNLKNYSPSHENSAKKMDNSMRRYAKKANSKDTITVEVKKESLSNKLEPMFVHKKPSLNTISSKGKNVNPIYQSSIGTIDYKESDIQKSGLVSSTNAQHRAAQNHIQSFTAPTTPRNTPSDPSKMVMPQNPAIPWIMTNESGQQLVGIIGQPLLMSELHQGKNGELSSLAGSGLGITYIPMNQIFIPTLTRTPLILGFFPNPGHTDICVAGSPQKAGQDDLQSPQPAAQQQAPTVVPPSTPVETVPTAPKDTKDTADPQPAAAESKKTNPKQPTSSPPLQTRLWTAQQRILLSLTNMTGLMFEHSARIRSSILPEKPKDGWVAPVAGVSSARATSGPAFSWATAAPVQVVEEKMHRLPMSRIDDFNARSMSRGVAHERMPPTTQTVAFSHSSEQPHLLKHAKSKTDLYKPISVARDISTGPPEFPLYVPQNNIQVPVLPQTEQYAPVSKYYIGSSTLGSHDRDLGSFDRPRGGHIVQIRSVSSSVNKIVVPTPLSSDQSQPSIYSQPASSNLQGMPVHQPPVYGSFSHQPNYQSPSSHPRPQH